MSEEYRALRKKDETSMRLGSKTEQLGLRLSEGEHRTALQVCAHWQLSLSGWVTYALLRFMERQQVELVPFESVAVCALRAWKAPTPTPHAKNCRVSPRLKEAFCLYAPAVPFSRAARWVLLDEAPRVLATPSAAERAVLRQRQLQELLLPPTLTLPNIEEL